MPLNIFSDLKPAGDQPKAIQDLSSALSTHQKHHQVLLGATGSGKTFTMANVIQNLNCSALIIAPNKTLAAQLYTEFKALFPQNAVGFFISYYDYYQPEAYVPSTDTYIAKDSAINTDIDKMRHETTRLLFEQKQTIIVSSVSCIYGLGSPDTYAQHVLKLSTGDPFSRQDLLKALVKIQYSRNDHHIQRGCFRVRGDIVTLLPAHHSDMGIRIDLSCNSITHLYLINCHTGETKDEIKTISIYPNSHYVTNPNNLQTITKQILTDLGQRLLQLKKEGNHLACERLEKRTLEDVESLEQIGTCPGIENYSRYLTGNSIGEAPPCLLDYFPNDFLTIIDESHITLPQIRGMFKGDQARKQTLVNYGFRLPSALDNRPLNVNEFMARTNRMLYVSATPAKEELHLAQSNITEQIIRPTGLVDPSIVVKKATNQVDDLLGELKKTVALKGRALVTTLTKKMAEDLTDYYRSLNLRIRYLHSDIDALQRTDILNDLRKGKFDILVGINLLREGLDLPEVKLVAIMDADKEGFLRSKSSLIQMVGRAARNKDANVIFYGNRITTSMQDAIDETKRRREKQLNYNKQHNITPKTVEKDIPKDLKTLYGLIQAEEDSTEETQQRLVSTYKIKTTKDLETCIRKQSKKMQQAAKKLDFEQAALIRDECRQLKALLLVYGEKTS